MPRSGDQVAHIIFLQFIDNAATLVSTQVEALNFFAFARFEE